MSVTPGQRLARLRLASQGLAGSRAASPADVVRSMMAMEAQDFAGAKWAVGVRLPGSTEAEVDRALAEGSIVRSWPMRGTLHFVAPEDLGWMLRLTTDRLITGAAGRLAALGLDEKQLETARAAAQDALHGGRALTRVQITRSSREPACPPNPSAATRSSGTSRRPAHSASDRHSPSNRRSCSWTNGCRSPAGSNTMRRSASWRNGTSAATARLRSRTSPGGHR